MAWQSCENKSPYHACPSQGFFVIFNVMLDMLVSTSLSHLLSAARNNSKTQTKFYLCSFISLSQFPIKLWKIEESSNNNRLRLKITFPGCSFPNVSFMVNLAKCYITLSLWGDISDRICHALTQTLPTEYVSKIFDSRFKNIWPTFVPAAPCNRDIIREENKNMIIDMKLTYNFYASFSALVLRCSPGQFWLIYTL